MGKSKDLATGAAYQDQTESDTRYVNTSGDTMTGTLVAGTRLQVGDASITQQYPALGYVADFQASTGSQTFISIAEPSASSLGNNGVIIGEDASDTYITQRGNKNIKLATQDLNRLIVDGSGRVTMPYQPSFRAYGSQSWTVISSGNIGTMTLVNENYDVGGNYNTSNYRFTAPVAGKYLIHLHAYVRLETHDDDSNHAYAAIYRNGSGAGGASSIYGYYNEGDYDSMANVTVIMDMAANDYATAVLTAASGSAAYYGGACIFSGILIG